MPILFGYVMALIFFFFLGFIVKTEHGITIGDYQENWPQWLQHYMGVVIVAAIGLVFAIMMPLVGLFFCCCRCGGACGARSKHEKHHDSCKRTTLTILLCSVAVVIL